MQAFSWELSHSALGNRWHAISATPNPTLLLQSAIACILSIRMSSIRSNWHISVRCSSMIGMETTRRLFARPVLLVAPGGEPPDAAAVRGHVAANRATTAAGGTTEIAQQEEKSINKDLRNRALSEKSVRAEAEPGLRLVVRANARFFGVFWGPLGWKTEPKRCRTRQCVVYFYRPKFENGNPG